jgi:hypothetical protein
MKSEGGMRNTERSKEKLGSLRLKADGIETEKIRR